MWARIIAACLALSALAGAAAPVRADMGSDKSAIAERLRRWTGAFNAKEAQGVCDLFAPDLVFSIPEIVRGTRPVLCGYLTKILADSNSRFHFDPPEIHDITVSGDIAVVRLTWTLTTRSGSNTDTAQEQSLDVFRRQPDGSWSLAQFVAFRTRPNGARSDRAESSGR